jgi:hypothetical protein
VRRGRSVQQWSYLVRWGHSGWVHVTIFSDGRLQIMSDYGNYAYWFGCPGMPMREFCISLDKDSDYLVRKLAPKKEFDGPGTYENVKKHLDELVAEQKRRDDGDEEIPEGSYLEMDKTAVFDGELAEELQLLKPFAPNFSDDVFEFKSWLDQTELDTAHEFAAYRHDQQAVHFCKEIWPLVCKEIRAELFKEQNRSRFRHWGKRRAA